MLRCSSTSPETLRVPGYRELVSMIQIAAAAAEAGSAPWLSGSDLFAGVAAIGAWIAVIVSWRIHQDQAGRIKVKMNIAAFSPATGVLAVAENGKYLYRPQKPADPVVELAQVVLENPGRTPVTVLSVELRLEGVEDGRYAETPRAFTLGWKKSKAPIGSVTPGISGDTRLRIDAYDHTTFLFDYLSVVDRAFRENSTLGEFNLVAEVTVAGHAHPYTSKKHGYWRIKRHIVSAIEPRTVRRPRNAALLELIRNSPAPHLRAGSYLNEIAVAIEQSLPLDASAQDIQRKIGEFVTDEAKGLFPDGERLMSGTASWAIRRHFDFLGPRLVPLASFSKKPSRLRG
jgi:hypothetical protein